VLTVDEVSVVALVSVVLVLLSLLQARPKKARAATVRRTRIGFFICCDSFLKSEVVDVSNNGRRIPEVVCLHLLAYEESRELRQLL
jgi:hypothetical protein